MKEVIKKPFHHDELKALVHTHALRLENEKNKKYNLLPSTEGIYYFKYSIQLYDLTIYQITLNSNS
jgi:DNA-binding response OmpR family regulator